MQGQEIYYVYILYSYELDRYYIGFTLSLEERLRKHNSNHKGYTGKANDWELVYRESYSSKQHAMKREIQLKSWKNRNRLKRLISKGSEYPDIQCREGH